MSPIMLLQVIFIVLKVLKLINWNWFAVFVPLYVQMVLIVIQALFFDD